MSQPSPAGAASSSQLDRPVGSFGLSALVAMTPDGVIGRDGGLPWRLGTDLRRFKRLTMGGTLIMGRRTYESIGRPLPGRRTVVITRNPGWAAEGVSCVASPNAALTVAQPDREFPGGRFVVGGAEIYQAMLPQCVEICLTRVLASIPGDTHLQLDLSDFALIERVSCPASDRDEFASEFLRLVRLGELGPADRK